MRISVDQKLANASAFTLDRVARTAVTANVKAAFVVGRACRLLHARSFEQVALPGREMTASVAARLVIASRTSQNSSRLSRNCFCP
jgi:hypothetical protein